MFTSAAMKRSGFGPGGLVGSLVLSSALLCISKPALAGDARVHDGLYLRLGGGLGYGFDSISLDRIQVTPGVFVTGEVKGTASGFAGATELALGWSLADGFVLGGGLYSIWFAPTASSVKANGTELPGDVEFDASSFHVLGPFVDYYFDPTAGLHLQAAIGYAGIALGDGHYKGVVNVPPLPPIATDVAVESVGGGGFGFMVGFGDEWWVSDSFSLGVLGRLTMGFMSGEKNGASWDHTAFAPALLFTATMN